MKTPFNQQELPLEAFQKLGIVKNGVPDLSIENFNALLAGRRTDLISLSDLKTDIFTIKQIDAKLSLLREDSGNIELLIHPIYKEARKHALLTELESEQLIKGNFTHLTKEITTPEGKPKSTIIEYDSQTKEFISYDPEEVIAPDTVNGYKLNAKQKEAFKKGEIVELPDGTQFQHRASDAKGVLSDHKMLLLSVLLDGGFSYLLLRGINNLAGNTLLQKDQNEEFDKAIQRLDATALDNNNQQVSYVSQQSRSYSKQQAR